MTTTARTSQAADAPQSTTTADRTRTAAYGALWSVVVLAAGFLVYENRSSWFGGDEWFIITDRGLTAGPGHEGLFAPHFEHWVALPVLAFRALYHLVGVTTYWPYIALVLVAHLAVVVLLWHVMTRARVDAWVATCACAVFAVLGTGFENLTSAWQVTLVAPLALGLGAILLAPETGPFTWRDTVCAALMLAAMLCSGVALPMLVAVALVALARRGWRVAAATAVVPAVAYAVWYAGWGHDTRDMVPPSTRAIPDFLWNGLTGALGELFRAEVIGVLVVLAAAAWLAIQATRRPLDRSLTVPVAFAIGGLAFLAGSGYRRGNLPGAISASRYLYVTIAFMLPLVARAANSLFSGSRGRRVLLALVTVVLVVAQARNLDHHADVDRPGKDSDRGALLATAALAREGRTFLLERPLNPFEPQVTVDEIVAMDADGKLPPLQGATDTDRLTVLARVDLAVGPGAVVPERSVARIESSGGVTMANDPQGCVVANGQPGNEIVLALDGPGTFRMRGDGTVGFHLRDTTQGLDGETVLSLLPRDREQVVSIATADDRLVVSLPLESPTVLCGLVQ